MENNNNTLRHILNNLSESTAEEIIELIDYTDFPEGTEDYLNYPAEIVPRYYDDDECIMILVHAGEETFIYADL
jgi:hypothetical protein